MPDVGLKGASAEPGIVLVCQAGTSLTQPQSKRDGAAEVGVVDLLHALLFEPVGDLDDRHALGAGAGRDADRVGDVVGVAVGDDDVGRVDFLAASSPRPGCWA